MPKNCQVFTPPEQVVNLLDASGYKTGLYGKKVLENSCGDGAILIEICRRYIESCLQEHYSLLDIKTGLERDIAGYEIEKDVFLACIANLHALVEAYGIMDVNWNVHCKDALKDSESGFDYIIGNPPFISYNDMTVEDRTFIQRKFSVCESGKVDYYYAFVQSGIEKLNPRGVLAYVLPSSIYKNISGTNVRKMILPYVKDVYDYSSSMQFKSIATSTTILVCKKINDIEKLTYHDVVNDCSFQIVKSYLTDKWYFTNEIEKRTGKRFGDYFKVANAIATLCNEAFLLNGAVHMNGFYYVDGKALEEKLVVKAVSMKNVREKNSQYIIFPYIFDDNKQLCRINEKELKESFPGIYSYLKKFKKRLLKRSSEKQAQWYEYGRSQGLSHMAGKKIVMSAIITNSVQTVMADENDVPFAGIYIQQAGELPLEYAEKILKSKEFWDYINVHSINSIGKSNRISVKEIQDFYFD